MFRSRHNSMSTSDTSGVKQARKRHLSMQDRVEMYNTVMALEEEQDNTLEETKVAPGTRVRKTSKVMFEPPELDAAQDGKVTAEVHQVIRATEIFSHPKYFLYRSLYQEPK